MHLAAVFQIQMKHLCKSNHPSALVLIDGGFVKNDAIGHYLTSDASET